jgi:ATP sulfurylase
MLMEGVSATIVAVKDGFAHKYWVYIVASKTANPLHRYDWRSLRPHYAAQGG